MYSYLDISSFNPHLFNEYFFEIVPVLKGRIFKNKTISGSECQLKVKYCYK